MLNKHFLFNPIKALLKENLNKFNKLLLFKSKMSSTEASNEQQVAVDSTLMIDPETGKPMSKRAWKRLNYKLTKEEKKQRVKERRAAVQETRDVGFDDNVLNHTDYYFENGLRKVKV